MNVRRRTFQNGQKDRIQLDAIAAVRPYKSKIPETRALSGVMRHADLVPKEHEQKAKKKWNLKIVAGLVAIPSAFVPIGIAFAHVKNLNLDSITISSLLSKDTYLQVGLAVTGLLGATFGAGLRRALPESMLSKVESAAFTLSSLALTVAALKPPPSPIHYPAAAAFFVGAAATMAAVGSNLIEHGKKAIGAFSVATSAVGSAAIAYGVSKNVHVPALEELVASIANGVWMGGMAIYALTKNKLSRN